MEQSKISNNSENEVSVPSVEARSQRHSRVFLRSLFFSRLMFRLKLDLKGLIRGIQMKFAKNRLFHRAYISKPIVVADPFGKFIRQTVAISVALLIITSIGPVHVLETGLTADAFTDTMPVLEEDELMTDPTLLINEEGFVLKTSPISEDASRAGYTDMIQHTVVSGDTLSGIAALYGLNVKTLMWGNNLYEDSTLKIGQTLVIPPLDGVSHTVVSNTETLTAIAKKYGVDVEIIKKHNKIEGDTIHKGDALFVPGGVKKDEPKSSVIVRTGIRTGARAVNTYDSKVVIASNDSPDAGKDLIYPTSGKITQGYRGGHYAVDIGNVSQPDIWAAASGTVVKAFGGCPMRSAGDRSCGGGYGNHVVIDHGNGLQTLYAHLETLYVTQSQAVESGQALGKMGNSGRSYGVTGIHLHFEVIQSGVKKNPSNYF